jgi:hypothetical protein
VVHSSYLFSIVGESGGVTVGSRGLITAGATPGSVVVKAALQEEGGAVQQVTFLFLYQITVQLLQMFNVPYYTKGYSDYDVFLENDKVTGI